MHELHFFVELFFFLTLKILETQPKEKKRRYCLSSPKFKIYIINKFKTKIQLNEHNFPSY